MKRQLVESCNPLSKTLEDSIVRKEKAQCEYKVLPGSSQGLFQNIISHYYVPRKQVGIANGTAGKTC